MYEPHRAESLFRS